MLFLLQFAYAFRIDWSAMLSGEDPLQKVKVSRYVHPAVPTAVCDPKCAKQGFDYCFGPRSQDCQNQLVGAGENCDSQCLRSARWLV